MTFPYVTAVSACSLLLLRGVGPCGAYVMASLGAAAFGLAGAGSVPTGVATAGNLNATVAAASLINMLMLDAEAAAAAATSAPDARGERPGNTVAGNGADPQGDKRRGRGPGRKRQATELNMEVHLLGDSAGNDTVEYLHAVVPASRPLAVTNQKKKTASDERPRRSASVALKPAGKRPRPSNPAGTVDHVDGANVGGGAAGAGDHVGLERDARRDDEPEPDPLALATQRYMGNLALCDNGMILAPMHFAFSSHSSLIE